MKHILISGMINIETTLKLETFPIEYTPVNYNFYGIDTTVSGVAYNVTKALKILGSEPIIMSLIGQDIYEPLIFSQLECEQIDAAYVKPILDATPHSIILYDDMGKRSIQLDLKNVQDFKYPEESIQSALEGIDLVVACNINFSRDIMRYAKEKGKQIATDVHVLKDIDDSYNKDFLEASNILFLSNEGIIGNETTFMKQLIAKYQNDIIVIGMGSQGAMIYVRAENKIQSYPAVSTRKVVSTIGAGDALFASFIYFYSQTNEPYQSLQTAILFASYKIGEKGAASGFLSEAALKEIEVKKTYTYLLEKY